MNTEHDHAIAPTAARSTSVWRAYLPAITSFVLLIGGIAVDQLAPQFLQPEWKRFVWYLLAYLSVGLPVLIKAIKAIAKGDVFSEFFLMSLATPPLLNGTSELHNELETKLAAFKDSEATLLFSCGFNAIGGWLNAMVREEDIFFYDEYNHASLHNSLLGVRCKKIPFRHNDMTDLRRKMEFYADTVNEKWLVVEGVYSMDGDIANLQEISLICDTYKGRLVVDDAHGTGILGLKGSGAAEILPREKVFLRLGTFSKSFAFTGGFICGSKDSINFLRYNTVKRHVLWL